MQYKVGSFEPKPTDTFKFIWYTIIQYYITVCSPSCCRSNLHTRPIYSIPWISTCTVTCRNSITSSSNIRPTAENLTTFICRTPGKSRNAVADIHSATETCCVGILWTVKLAAAIRQTPCKPTDTWTSRNSICWARDIGPCAGNNCYACLTPGLPAIAGRTCTSVESVPSSGYMSSITNNLASYGDCAPAEPTDTGTRVNSITCSSNILSIAGKTLCACFCRGVPIVSTLASTGVKTIPDSCDIVPGALDLATFAVGVPVETRNAGTRIKAIPSSSCVTSGADYFTTGGTAIPNKSWLAGTCVWGTAGSSHILTCTSNLAAFWSWAPGIWIVASTSVQAIAIICNRSITKNFTPPTSRIPSEIGNTVTRIKSISGSICIQNQRTLYLTSFAHCVPSKSSLTGASVKPIACSIIILSPTVNLTAFVVITPGEIGNASAGIKTIARAIDVVASTWDVAARGANTPSKTNLTCAGRNTVAQTCYVLAVTSNLASFGSGIPDIRPLTITNIQVIAYCCIVIASTYDFTPLTGGIPTKPIDACACIQPISYPWRITNWTVDFTPLGHRVPRKQVLAVAGVQAIELSSDIATSAVDLATPGVVVPGKFWDTGAGTQASWSWGAVADQRTVERARKRGLVPYPCGLAAARQIRTIGYCTRYHIALNYAFFQVPVVLEVLAAGTVVLAMTSWSCVIDRWTTDTVGVYQHLTNRAVCSTVD